MKIYLCFIHDRFYFITKNYEELLGKISAVTNKCAKDDVKF